MPELRLTTTANTGEVFDLLREIGEGLHRGILRPRPDLPEVTLQVTQDGFTAHCARPRKTGKELVLRAVPVLTGTLVQTGAGTSIVGRIRPSLDSLSFPILIFVLSMGSLLFGDGGTGAEVVAVGSLVVLGLIVVANFIFPSQEYFDQVDALEGFLRLLAENAGAAAQD